MITQWLQEVMTVSGVEGVFVTSNRGQIIDKIGLSLNQSTLEGIAVHVLRIVSGYHVQKRSLKEIEIIWNNYRIIALNTQKFVIITFCSSAKALSLLRITLNVVLSHLLEDKKFMKQIDKHALEKTVVLRKGHLEPLEINLISKLQ